MKIEIEKRNVWGNELLYVRGKAAAPIQKLTGRKTVNPVDIFALEQLGLEVVFVGNEEKRALEEIRV